ncbi:MAG: sulfite exporter TauE/SafE family protein [Planctomycetota bacterium]
MDEASRAALLVLVGLFTGVLNVLAGGGSLVTVPLLILLGVPATLANATTRPALIAQNAAALLSYVRAGLFRDALWRGQVLKLGAVALPLAILGAHLAARLHFDPRGDAVFEGLLATALLAVAALTLWRELRGPVAAPRPEVARFGLVLGLFAVVGFYSGFLQAGVGFVVMATLLHGTPWSMARISAAKVAIIGSTNLVATLVFAGELEIAWGPALALVVGQTAGGVLGSRLSLRIDDRVLRRVFLVLLVACALAILFR